MSPRTLGGADGPDADADFWRWASSRGVVAVRCESRDVAEGWRGIVATEVIERDAVVLRVPGALLMSARSMNEDTQLCDAFRAYDSSAGAGLTPADKLTVHLLREASKGRDSRWHTYISRLPRAYNLLCVWTRRERAMLQDPRAIAVAERARQATRSVVASRARCPRIARHDEYRWMGNDSRVAVGALRGEQQDRARAVRRRRRVVPGG